MIADDRGSQIADDPLISKKKTGSSNMLFSLQQN